MDLATRALLVVCLTLGLPCAPAHAQGRDAVTAEALFREGRDAVKRGDFTTACPKFAESQRLDPAPGTVLNLAQCEEKLGQYASAWQHYQEAAEQLGPDDSRRAVATSGAARTAKLAPKLTVRLPADAPAGTIVRRDGVELGRPSLGTPLPIDPGEHLLEVVAPGHETTKRTVIARAGDSSEVVLDVGAAIRSTPPASSGQAQRPQRPGQPPLAEQPSSNTRTIGYVVGGAGLVALAAGTYFALDAKAKDDTAIQDYGCSNSPAVCRDQRGVDLTEQSQRSARYSAAGFIVGGLALAAGATLVLTSRNHDGQPAAGADLTLRAAASVDSMRVQLGAAW